MWNKHFNTFNNGASITFTSPGEDVTEVTCIKSINSSETGSGTTKTRQKSLFLDLFIAHLFIRASAGFALTLSLAWFFSPGYVSPLRALTKVNTAGTRQAVAKLWFDIRPQI